MSVRRALPLLSVALLLLSGLTIADGAWAAPVCRQGEAVRIWTAPLAARPGEKLEIVAVATDSELTELVVTDPAGRRTELSVASGGGPPWSLRGTLPAAGRGSYRIEARRAGQAAACAEVQVGGGAGNRGSGEWDQATQALFAAWVEHLFEAPSEQSLSFPSLEPVLRDPARNFLHDYLAKGEDNRVAAEPDCADLAYFLRAYFAWKLGLPVAYRSCTRGTATSAPRCDAPEIDRSFMGTTASAEVFRRVSRSIMDRVTSGGGRTGLNDDATDFYPVPLKRASLWPGTVYADPYGHTLMIVKWIPQTDQRGGLLLAVDAQPDNSVARKRFWEGTFLFARTPSAGPGFKAYRPPLAGGAKGGLTPPANSALANRAGLPPYSTEQATLAPSDFYARMERLINPRGLDPEAAYAATLAALMEQLETRIKSVDNGEEYMRGHRGTVVGMPKGPAIFETVGPWEDYATPSRDMRLLIALKVLADLPGRIRSHPDGRARAFGLADTDRNTQSLLDVRYHRWFGWDGAGDSLWAQSVRPILEAREMGGSQAQAAALVRGDAELACRFEKVFGAPPPAADEAVLAGIGKALAAFQETLVSGRSPFDDFRDALSRGDLSSMKKYPQAAQRGLRIFVGRGNCSTCHFGPAFSNGEFHDTGVPFFLKGGADPGRHGGIRKLQANPLNLLGAHNDEASGASAVKTRQVALEHRNFGEFKVPSLRNVARTAPYMHNGSLATLADVVRHYSEINPDRLHSDGEALLKPLRLSPGEAADLVAFLESLTERESALAPRRPGTSCR